MARKKKPVGETTEQAGERHSLESISNRATRSEKVSWDRKMDNMVKLLSLLRPIEEKITDLMEQKQPVLDQIATLRKEMVVECIHPYPHMLLKHDEQGECIVCKFCNTRFSVNSGRP